VNRYGITRILFGIASLVVLQPWAMAQLAVDYAGSAEIDAPLPLSDSFTPPVTIYARPSPRTRLGNYAWYTVGPYPVAGAALIAAMNQADNTPREWGQGAAGYGKRFGSDFAIDAIGTTTGYALGEIFKQDIVYYPCECGGLFPRLRHAITSTLTARRGSDGHRMFSVPLLVAPYTATMTAVYGWYPDRYGAMDGFTMGNYYLAGSAAENIVLEFMHRRHRSQQARMHFRTFDAERTSSSR
jgi:hypothetical protein